MRERGRAASVVKEVSASHSLIAAAGGFGITSLSLLVRKDEYITSLSW